MVFSIFLLFSSFEQQLIMALPLQELHFKMLKIYIWCVTFQFVCYHTNRKYFFS